MQWFFQHVFFPQINERGIKTIICLGDLVDRRKYINYHTLSKMKTDFLDEIRDRKLDFFVIGGNHDLFFKNTTSLNALDELLYGYDFNIFTSPKMIRLPNRDCLMLPWITSENRGESMGMVGNLTSSDIVFGHLELAGFTMNPGTVAEHGDDPAPFSKAAAVYTGHYHSKSSKGNIHYLGAPFAFNWGDYGDSRGFHILDLDTLELEFIENPYTMFQQFIYDDREPLPEVDSNVMNRYVKVIVNHKVNQAPFEAFLKKVDSKQPLDIKIVEKVELEIDKETFTGEETTPEIIRKYIGQVNSPKKDDLERLMMKLYNDAVLME